MNLLESNLAERVRQLKICVFYSISRLFQGEKDLDEDTTQDQRHHCSEITEK